MAGKEYAICNTYGYVNYLDEDGIECLREHGETVEILGDADDFRRMGYRSGDDAPPKASTSSGLTGHAKRAVQAGGVFAGLIGAVAGAPDSLASSALNPSAATGQISHVVQSEQTRERQRRSGHVNDSTRDQGSGYRRSGKR